jgi:hypothetical protein
MNIALWTTTSLFLPIAYYGIIKERELPFNWFRDVMFPCSLIVPVAFQQVVLNFAAQHRAKMRGEHDTKESAYQMSKGLRLLKEWRMKYPQDCSDQAITALLLQVTHDDFFSGIGDKRNCWVHMRAVMEMIRERGGSQAFEKNARMAMLINVLDYGLAGYQNRGLALSYFHEPTGGTSYMINQEDVTVRELQVIYREFLTFLSNADHLVLVQSSEYSHPQGLRRSTFRKGTILFQLLTYPPSVRPGNPGYRNQICYRMSILLHLNAALWDFRASHTRTERFLRDLN